MGEIMRADRVFQFPMIVVTPLAADDPTKKILRPVVEELGPLICREQTQPTAELVSKLGIESIKIGNSPWQRTGPTNAVKLRIRTQQSIAGYGGAGEYPGRYH